MNSIKVRKTTFEEEQEDKNEDFLKLSPMERLAINEELRKRIWGEKYYSTIIPGSKVRRYNSIDEKP
jgi:hypothetical protein